nr:hypothetical protein [Planctomycetota bacterium]
MRYTVEMVRRAAERDPAAFRRYLRIDPASEKLFGDIAEPWQAADFAALDAAWCDVAGITPSVRGGDASQTNLRRAWIERPRGHAKTGDMAVQIAWALLFAKRPLRGIAAAADLDQAGLIADAVRTLTLANPGLCDVLR